MLRNFARRDWARAPSPARATAVHRAHLYVPSVGALQLEQLITMRSSQGARVLSLAHIRSCRDDGRCRTTAWPGFRSSTQLHANLAAMQRAP